MATVEKSDRRISPAKLGEFCTAILLRCGMREADARIVADVLVTTDCMGIFTHGVKNLPGYVRRLQAGGINAQAQPRVIGQGPAWAVVDGGSGMGMVGASLAMRTAVEKARAAGLAYVGVRNSCHFGAAGYYALLAVKEDMIGMSMSNDIPSMTAPGARSHIVGTNPFAVAIPAGAERPILLDIAMSTVAGGKVYAAVSQGKPIPNTWIVDGQGLPTTDGSVYPHTASLLPMAGHKGYGLALMIETLSALLTAAAARFEVGSWIFDDPSKPTNHGHAFLAINAGAIVPIEQFKQRMDEMIRQIRQSPKAQGSDRIFLPGEMEWERQADALANGIALPKEILTALADLSKDLGIALDHFLA